MRRHTKRLRQINLNSLPILRAVLKHQNLTRAAEELNLTQSAVSNSLKQLRQHFGDALLVKHGTRMRLTRKAVRLLPQLDHALSAVEDVLQDEGFDPHRANRRFRIATADYVSALMAPTIANILAREAPSISMQMLTAHGRSPEDLRTERIDLIISPRQIVDTVMFDAPDLARESHIEPLMRDRFVCIGRDDDPALAGGLTLEEYLARPHASFFLDVSMHANIEQTYIEQAAIGRKDRILTSNFLVLAYIVACSDCLTLLPEGLARIVARSLPLRIVDSPLPVPEIDLVMVWLARRDRDPELTWLRNLLHRCSATAAATEAVPA